MAVIAVTSRASRASSQTARTSAARSRLVTARVARPTHSAAPLEAAAHARRPECLMHAQDAPAVRLAPSAANLALAALAASRLWLRPAVSAAFQARNVAMAEDAVLTAFVARVPVAPAVLPAHNAVMAEPADLNVSAVMAPAAIVARLDQSAVKA